MNTFASDHARLTAAGVVHRFAGERLEVRVLQPGQSAPWWPAVAHGGRPIPLPAAVEALPEIAAALAVLGRLHGPSGDTPEPSHVRTPEAAPEALAASREAERVKAWKLRNREKVQAQKRRARERAAA